MKITAITLSVNYGDILKMTLLHMLDQFDSVYVVTDEQDRYTRSLARRLNANLVETNIFYDGGAKFNKSKAINLAYRLADANEWVALIDADIMLPENFRDIANNHICNIDHLYSAPRVVYNTYEDLINNNYSKDNLGKKTGWGYLQIFHPKCPKINKYQLYNERYHDASSGDVEFRYQWGEDEIITLPIVLKHLGPVKSNWSGRRAPEFSPPKTWKDSISKLRPALLPPLLDADRA